MKITYVSGTMDTESFFDLFHNSPKIPGQQAQKFNRLMIEGLAKNGASVTSLSGIPVTSTNCSRKFIGKKTLENKDVTWKYPSVLNVKRIKNLWQMVAIFFGTLANCLKKDSVVVCDVLNASISYGATLAGRLLGRPCVGIVTDLPHLMVTGTDVGHTKLVNRVMKKCTHYVFLTEAMNEAVNKSGKPYVIIEGVCDSDFTEIFAEDEQTKEKICMYAGLLDARYGAKAMVDAFLQANVLGSSLHLYGNGPYVKELEAIVQNYPNVVYHGTVMNEEIVMAEQKASLLINPRPTHEEFTKYSFPSKNLEYMISGTPVLTTKLPGMPREYYPYVYLFEDESVLGMAKVLKDVLSKPEGELEKKGNEAQIFVKENKNNVYQTKKLLDMLYNNK